MGAAVQETGALRLKQLFLFLREYARIRFPYKRHLKEHRWFLWLADLPDHPSIEVARVGAGGEEETPSWNGGPGILLAVRRPKLTPPPKPPVLLKDWLRPGWDDPFREAEVLPSRRESRPDGGTAVVRFAEDPRRVREFRRWVAQRDTWAQNERPAREAAEVFRKFYELYGELGREGERIELILADGTLSWRGGWGSLYHPILLLPVQLEFDPGKPEFRVVDAGRRPDLYTAPLRDLPIQSTRELSRIQEELNEGRLFVHPLESEDTTAFLRRFVQSLAPRASYAGDKRPPEGATDPVLGRSPVLFVRDRSHGYARAVEFVLQDLERKKDLPSSLLSIVGVRSEDASEVATDSGVGNASSTDVSSDLEPERILFSKP